MIEKSKLEELYVVNGNSMKEIASKLDCSVNKIVYWMSKYDIKRRTISESIYLQANPSGDPFKIKQIASYSDAYLLGLGIGIFWGEGNKRNKHSVRLGNTDPDLIIVFIRFLTEICGIDSSKLRFGLQIFSDMNPQDALTFWSNRIGFEEDRFQRVVVTPARSIGTYREKTKHGVLTIYFHNYKLRDIIVELCRDSSVGRAHPWWVVSTPPTGQEISQ